MTNKIYQTPKMEIIDYKLQASLLSGSDRSIEPCDDGDYCDELGFNFHGSNNHNA